MDKTFNEHVQRIVGPSFHDLANQIDREGAPSALQKKGQAMRVYQHIPNFVETDTRREAEVETAEELLMLPWVAEWSQPFGERPFHRFSKTRVEGWRDQNGTHHRVALMVEHSQGRHWWVVAYVYGAPETLDALDLPEWQPKE